MAYLLQQRRHVSNDTAWLATLVQTFESTEQDCSKPCDATVIAGFKAQLARPAASRPSEFETIS